MLFVSLAVEALRAYPRLVFWAATLAQAGLWVLVPGLFYASPPGDLPLTLAVGREWPLGLLPAPPLAYWLAEAAFRLAGGHVIGVYLLSQICVVITYWAVFTLGCALVGASHAVMAVLLMTGIHVFATPSVEFGPTVAAMPLTALALLFYWRAVAEQRRRCWIALAIALGLLTLTSHFGLVLFLLMLAFAAATERGRTELLTWPGGAAFGFVVLCILLIYWPLGAAPAFALAPTGTPRASPLGALFDWLRLVLPLIVDHGGVVVLVVVAVAFGGRRLDVPVIARAPLGSFGKVFVYFFALAPALTATLIAALFGRSAPIGGSAPLLTLSGLAVIVAAGESIPIHRQHLVSWVWLGLLVGPAVVTVLAIFLLPWTVGIALDVTEPARPMGRFFTEAFNRRTGRPLAVVTGDVRYASLIALASPDRPSVFIEGAPWARERDIREKGAVVVWAPSDSAGQPPPAIRARFPELVPEPPRLFERSVQGRLPLLRVGWAVVRPAQ
jgi:hypothetical protein